MASALVWGAYQQPTVETILELQDTRRQALSLAIEQNEVNVQNIDDAKSSIEFSRSAHEWKQFIEQLLLWAGTLALSCGVIFFIAANWQDIGRFAKFAIVEAMLALSVFAYWRYRDNNLIANGALISSMFSIGGLMALFGQTYQTGADPWQLFFNWALLSTPLVLISRFAPIWFIWLGLLNLALALFLDLYYSGTQPINIIWAASFISLVSWNIASRRFTFLNKTWGIGMLAIYSAYLATFSAADAIFSNIFFNTDSTLQFVAWFAWLSAIAYFFYIKERQISVLACTCVSVIFVINMLILEAFNNNFDGLMFFVCAIVTICGGALSTLWLKHLHQEQKQAEKNHA